MIILIIIIIVIFLSFKNRNISYFKGSDGIEYTLKEKAIYDSYGIKKGFFKDYQIYNNNGVLIGTVKGNTIINNSGKTILTKTESKETVLIKVLIKFLFITSIIGLIIILIPVIFCLFVIFGLGH